jgi:hypothetical protein
MVTKKKHKKTQNKTPPKKPSQNNIRATVSANPYGRCLQGYVENIVTILHIIIFIHKISSVDLYLLSRTSDVNVARFVLQGIIFALVILMMYRVLDTKTCPSNK